MEIITILKDETHNRRLMQIDLNELAKNEEVLEDSYDLSPLNCAAMKKPFPGMK